MSARSLPERPNLAHLKRQAQELGRDHRQRKPAAAARIVAHHPDLEGLAPDAVLDRPLALSAAQLVIAREYGFESWARLKQRVEIAEHVAACRPHPRFDEAVAAMDAGDLEALRALLAAEPALVHARTNLEPPYHYFTAATLLHHVAGNPDRGRLSGQLPPLPATIVDAARLLIDAGADVHARTLGPNGGTTMGLVVTSKAASDANVSGPLIDLLIERGATLDVTSPGVLDGPLANHAPRAAEKMIARGAKVDLTVAAALGRLDWLRAMFDERGRLRSTPRRRGRIMSARDVIGLALLFAYVNRHANVVDFLLEQDGNWNMIGVNNGTALHRAAWDGDLAMVQRLAAKGADVANRNNPFTATPLSWADHNHQTEVFAWMRAHCAIDLHDAVGFDLPEHVAARLREDPASVNRRLDHWDIPQSTALHWAAVLNRETLAATLLDHGADPNIVAGNGRTALDLVNPELGASLAALLVRHGGKRAAEL
jgi:hypothetical protein